MGQQKSLLNNQQSQANYFRIKSNTKLIQHQNILKLRQIPFRNSVQISNSPNLYLEERDITLVGLLKQRYYSSKLFPEQDIVKLIETLINCLSFLQNKNILYPDLSLENIFYDCIESNFKLFPIQLIRENGYLKCLYKKRFTTLSPEMVIAFRCGEIEIDQDIYNKSNVFILGMILLEVVTLRPSSECYDEQNFDILDSIINQRLHLIKGYYSSKIVKFIALMLDYDYSERISFSQLNEMIGKQLYEEKLKAQKSRVYKKISPIKEPKNIQQSKIRNFQKIPNIEQRFNNGREFGSKSPYNKYPNQYENIESRIYERKNHGTKNQKQKCFERTNLDNSKLVCYQEKNLDSNYQEYQRGKKNLANSIINKYQESSYNQRLDHKNSNIQNFQKNKQKSTYLNNDINQNNNSYAQKTYQNLIKQFLNKSCNNNKKVNNHQNNIQKQQKNVLVQKKLSYKSNISKFDEDSQINDCNQSENQNTYNNSQNQMLSNHQKQKYCSPIDNQSYAEFRSKSLAKISMQKSTQNLPIIPQLNVNKNILNSQQQGLSQSRQKFTNSKQNALLFKITPPQKYSDQMKQNEHTFSQEQKDDYSISRIKEEIQKSRKLILQFQKNEVGEKTNIKIL